MNIESCNTWQCINSFAPWISATGTIFISGVSLWLAIKDKLIQLEARLFISEFPIDNYIRSERWAYAISFVNLGPRPITITNYEWHFRLHPFGKRKKSFISPYKDEMFLELCTKLPCELTDGKQGRIFHSIDIFRNLENSSDFLLADNPLVAFYRISTFNIFVCTSTGKKVKAKISRDLRREIWKQYKGVSSCKS